MPIPQELKDQLISSIHAGTDVVLGDALGQSYDAGVASVPVGQGGGFSQQDLDNAVAAAVTAVKDLAKGAVDSADADTQTDIDLKALIDAIAYPVV